MGFLIKLCMHHPDSPMLLLGMPYNYAEIFKGHKIRRFHCRLKILILKKKQWLKETI